MESGYSKCELMCDCRQCAAKQRTKMNEKTTSPEHVIQKNTSRIQRACQHQGEWASSFTGAGLVGEPKATPEHKEKISGTHLEREIILATVLSNVDVSLGANDCGALGRRHCQHIRMRRSMCKSNLHNQRTVNKMLEYYR